MDQKSYSGAGVLLVGPTVSNLWIFASWVPCSVGRYSERRSKKRKKEEENKQNGGEEEKKADIWQFLQRAKNYQNRPLCLY